MESLAVDGIWQFTLRLHNTNHTTCKVLKNHGRKKCHLCCSISYEVICSLGMMWVSKSLNQATFHIAIPLAAFPYLPPPWFVDVAWRRTTCVHLSWHYQKNTRSSTTLFQQRALDPCHIYDTRRSAAPHIKKTAPVHFRYTVHYFNIDEILC